MKYIICCITLMLVLPVESRADAAREITVTGEASMEVMPDQANIYLTIETFANRMDTAETRHGEKLAKLTELGKPFGITEAHVQQLNRDKKGRYRIKNGQELFDEFIITDYLVLHLKKAPQTEALVEAITEEKLATVQTINYSISERDDLLEKLNAKALVNARQQALMMVRAIGARLGSPIRMGQNIRAFNNVKADAAVQSAMPEGVRSRSAVMPPRPPQDVVVDTQKVYERRLNKVPRLEKQTLNAYQTVTFEILPRE